MDLMLERPEGLRHAYAYTGGKAFDPHLPVVVFLHGALFDHSVWTLLARWFAHHGHSVLAPDLPGHARSRGKALTSVEALADWVLGLLDAAGVQRAALVGHSMGSLISLEAAGRSPQRVSHLAMLGTAFPMAVSSALLDTARDAPLRAIDMVNAYSHSTMAGKPAYPGPGTWLHGAARALMRRVQASQRDGNLFLPPRAQRAAVAAVDAGLDATVAPNVDLFVSGTSEFSIHGSRTGFNGGVKVFF